MQRKAKPYDIGSVRAVLHRIREVGVLQFDRTFKRLQLALGEFERWQRQIHAVVVRYLGASERTDDTTRIPAGQIQEPKRPWKF
jgi:hypothetical protein